MKSRRRTWSIAATGVAVVCCVALSVLGGCAGNAIDARGSVYSADGVVLAQSNQVTNGKGVRSYPMGKSASALLGSCYTDGAPEGIEQRYEKDLLEGSDVVLTVDSRVQDAAVKALGDHAGAVVVEDPSSGAILAMASTPSYDPGKADASKDELANHATELHIPGSTFKTITLAAAIESQAVKPGDVFPAPASLTFEEGQVSNYGGAGYSDQTVERAFAQSINTVFAQIALKVGTGQIYDMASRFGFGSQLMDDFPLKESAVRQSEQMTSFVQAWLGVGQSLYQPDGSMLGPVMTVVQGAAVASVVANDGVLMRPYVVESIGGLEAEHAKGVRVVENATAGYLSDCMKQVVTSGTGKSAAVAGADVRGKTGTAETISGLDDGWFIGFVNRGERTYAVSVFVEGAQSAEASSVASEVMASLVS